MSQAYVETTVLTDALLKPGDPRQDSALSALKKYNRTFLPVYSIKEMKAGPLTHFVWLHDKLAITRSLSQTFQAMSKILRQPYKVGTSLEALSAAATLSSARRKELAEGSSPSMAEDENLAARYRLAIKFLIFRSWKQRRSLTHEVIQDLDCYDEVDPHENKNGLIEIAPRLCRNVECCLADRLRARPDVLVKLRDAIPESSSRAEDVKRRKILRQLYRTPKEALTREQCRQLGDAIFAFFSPDDCVVLTTNLRDHLPLAQSIGKTAESP